MIWIFNVFSGHLKYIFHIMKWHITDEIMVIAILLTVYTHFFSKSEIRTNSRKSGHFKEYRVTQLWGQYNGGCST